jgi:hypothetical protein
METQTEQEQRVKEKEQVFNCGCIMYYDNLGKEVSVKECLIHSKETNNLIEGNEFLLTEDVCPKCQQEIYDCECEIKEIADKRKNND